MEVKNFYLEIKFKLPQILHLFAVIQNQVILEAMLIQIAIILGKKNFKNLKYFNSQTGNCIGKNETECVTCN